MAGLTSANAQDCFLCYLAWLRVETNLIVLPILWIFVMAQWQRRSLNGQLSTSCSVSTRLRLALSS